MEIKNNLNPLDPYSRTTIAETKNGKAVQRGAQNATTPGSAGETGDRVSLSPEAKLRTEALTTAMNTPDDRQSRVQELKALVQSGEYVTDSKASASKTKAEDPGTDKT